MTYRFPSMVGGIDQRGAGHAAAAPPPAPVPPPGYLDQAAYNQAIRAAIAGDRAAQQRLLEHRRARSEMNRRK